MQKRDNGSILSAERELRDLARVIRRALGMVQCYWVAMKLPPSHPYRQAARMVESYLETHYG